MDLRAADRATLSFAGQAVCPAGFPGFSGGEVFAYGDQREAIPLGHGLGISCDICSDTSDSGQVPAVKGKTYTATFYLTMNSVPGLAPPECAPFGDAGDTGYLCEVSASAVF
jgi:hypothetical protein